jgi:hypothetical protein
MTYFAFIALQAKEKKIAMVIDDFVSRLIPHHTFSLRQTV